MYISVDDVMMFFERLFERTPEQILSVGAQMADMLETHAKANAPWTDRTGMARATIEGINRFADGGTETYCIGVCGNQPYSPNLEQGFGRRYAILFPTVMKYEKDMLENIRAVIGRQEGLS